MLANTATIATSQLAGSGLVVKVRHGEEIRRFGFSGSSFQSLVAIVKQLFSVPESATVSLKWKDEEGDLVTMSSDAELQEAIRSSSQSLQLQFSLNQSTAPCSPAAGVPAVPAAAVQPAAAAVPVPAAPACEKGQGKPAWAVKQGKGRWGRGCHHGRPVDQEAPQPFWLQRPHGRFAPVAATAPAAAPAPATTPSAPVDSPAASTPAPAEAPAAPKQMPQWKQEKMRMISQWKEEKQKLKEQIRLLKTSNSSDKTQLKERIQTLRAELQEKKQQMRRFPQENIAIARFVRDITLPDGIEVAPGARLVKVWRFRNDSAKAWPEGSRLLWVGKRSDRLDAPESTPVPSCQPGQEVDVSVPLVAPAQAGRYTAYFRLAGPLGKRFGQRLWVIVSVAESSSSSDEGNGKPTDIPVGDVSKYAPQLKSLAEMGYVNLKVNMRLLQKFDGNVERVVSQLIRRQQRQASVPTTKTA